MVHQAKIQVHVRHGGPKTGLGHRHPMNQSSLKRHRHFPTSSGRDCRQIIPITCRRVITIPITCPKDIQDIIILGCHRIRSLLLKGRNACVLPRKPIQNASNHCECWRSSLQRMV
jgi:hypothetical protein